MEKKLTHKGEGSDELALVKAAAWAWHQHGYDRKPAVAEFDATRTRQTYKPSRYKLEVVRMTEENSTKEDEEASSLVTISPDHADNSLLDRYEIESISKRLEYLIKSSSTRSLEADQSGFIGGGSALRRQKSISSEADWFKKKKKNVLKGMWLRHGVMCGTNEDVDVKASIGNRQRPKRFVPAVSIPICISRAAHAP